MWPATFARRSPLTTVKAFVLVNIELGKERIVLDMLKRIPSVRDAYLTYGVYDILVLVEADKMDRIKSAITNEIRALPGIRSTMTMVIVDN